MNKLNGLDLKCTLIDKAPLPVGDSSMHEKGLLTITKDTKSLISATTEKAIKLGVMKTVCKGIQK